MKSKKKYKSEDNRTELALHTPGRKSLYVTRQEMRRLSDALFELAAKASSDEFALEALKEARILVGLALKSDHLPKPGKTGSIHKADRLLDALQKRLGRQTEPIDAEIVPPHQLTGLTPEQKERANGRAEE